MKNLENELVEDEVYICSACGEEFIFRAKVNATDLEDFFTPEEAKKLIDDREIMEQRIDDLIQAHRIEEAMEYQDELNALKNLICYYADVKSQESYTYHGLTYLPQRCPTCRRKRKAKTLDTSVQKSR